MIDFLGFIQYIVSTVGSKMDPKGVTSIEEWATPAKAKNVHISLDLPIYMEDLSHNFSPLLPP